MKQYMPLKIAVTALGILAASVHLWKPDLHIDSTTIILLVIAALPWARPLIKSIELLGVKLELQELQNRVAEATGAAESANRQAGLALAASNGQPEPMPSAGSPLPDNTSEIHALAERYNEIRHDQRSGDARTAAMTVVVRQMIDVARRTPSFNLDAALTDSNRGMRLFAYVLLYARPDAQMLLPLIESITRKEDKPFGQYWGLQSIGRVLPLASHSVLWEAKSRLLTFASRVPPGSDRDYELKKLLRQIDQTDSAD